MRIEGLSNKMVVGFGVLGSVCAKTVFKRKPCIDVPEQDISNIMSHYNQYWILENMSDVKFETYNVQQKIYDIEYYKSYQKFWNKKYAWLVQRDDWYKANDRVRRCIEFEFRDIGNSTWWYTAKAITEDKNIIAPLNCPIIPRADLVCSTFGEDYLRNKVVYLDKTYYNNCAKQEIENFCSNGESIWDEVTRLAVAIPAVLSVIFLSQSTAVLIRTRLNALRAHRLDNLMWENFQPRQRHNSNASDETLVADEIEEVEQSDNTLLIREIEIQESDITDVESLAYE